MILVSARVAVRPDRREQAAEAARKMVEATQKEAGCREYNFYWDVRDPNLIHVFEIWESDEALNAHFQTPHMAEFAQALPDVLAEEPKIYRYVVTETSQLGV